METWCYKTTLELGANPTISNFTYYKNVTKEWASNACSSSGGAAFHLTWAAVEPLRQVHMPPGCFSWMQERPAALRQFLVKFYSCTCKQQPIISSVLMNYHTAESSTEDFTSSIKILISLTFLLILYHRRN